MVGRTKERLILIALLCVAFAHTCAAQSTYLHQMSLDRWAKLREVERHQMKVAEKYFQDRNWSVAADEYDKYLTLYEASDAASHALLKWSICQVEMRRQNTAINDGFRSVVDYWPDSDDAIAASYYVGKTLKDIGQTQKAKSALNEVATDHAKHLAGVLAMVALADIALQPDGCLVTLGDISRRQDVSLPYLEQLFVKLRRANLVESVRGPGGGYRLARPATEIRVVDVLAAVDETVDAMHKGAGASGAASGSKAQSLTNRLWQSLSAHVYVFLHNATLADVAQNKLLPCPAVPDILSVVDEQIDDPS